MLHNRIQFIYTLEMHINNHKSHLKVLYNEKFKTLHNMNI